MMSTSEGLSPSAAAMSCLNWREPLRAMVPRFCSNSSFVMPMPLSLMVRVRAIWSGVRVIFSSDRSTPTLSSVRAL